MLPSILLTRPVTRNQRLAARLSDYAAHIVQAPALELQARQFDLSDLPLPVEFDGVIFVSRLAANLYLQHWQKREPFASWPAATWAATVGSASAAALKESGHLSDNAIFYPQSQNQDSEALWALLKERNIHPKKVLIVRGTTGREWLGQQFEAQGVQVSRFSIYARQPASWSDATDRAVIQALSRAGGQPELSEKTFILLTSSEGVRAFYQHIARLEQTSYLEKCVFIVIHKRIAMQLQSILRSSATNALPNIVVCEPSDDAIFQTIHGLAKLKAST